ncbi:hypothetical protein FFI89_001065 [Bradyrhizobium sp. KBS0727]|nr:hypothetical protein FFI71_001065 [Bradyrhizobium sp. KBS0725]QDW48348.1 hypothetical protein FFI89_001065 [Bradyrhizobium sp. KBS0727]
MLHVTVEIWPGGSEIDAWTVATADIANVSESNCAKLSRYHVRATEGVNPLAGTPEWEAVGQILNHDRRSSVWSLVAKVAAWAIEQQKTGS